MADQAAFAPRSMKRKNVKGLALTPAAAPKQPPADAVHADHGRDELNQTAQLEIGIEYKMDLRPEELEFIKELGSGNGGTVSKVRHVTTGTIMARKVGSTSIVGGDPPPPPEKGRKGGGVWWFVCRRLCRCVAN